MMDGKRFKHIDIYRSLESKMQEQGFDKNAAQMRIKMKHLKEQYFKCKRSNGVSGAGRTTFQFFDQMNGLFGERPSTKAIVGEGIDSSADNVIECDQLPFDDIIEDNSMGMEDAGPPLKAAKKGGRITHAKMAENFAEVFSTKQADQMRNVMKEQVSLLNEMMDKQMECQRKWEEEMQEREHQHQTWMLRSFMSGVNAAGVHPSSPYEQFEPNHSSCSSAFTFKSSPSLSTSISTPSPPGVYALRPSPSPETSRQTITTEFQSSLYRPPTPSPTSATAPIPIPSPPNIKEFRSSPQFVKLRKIPPARVQSPISRPPTPSFFRIIPSSASIPKASPTDGFILKSSPVPSPSGPSTPTAFQIMYPASSSGIGYSTTTSVDMPSVKLPMGSTNRNPKPISSPRADSVEE